MNPELRRLRPVDNPGRSYGLHSPPSALTLRRTTLISRGETPAAILVLALPRPAELVAERSERRGRSAIQPVRGRSSIGEPGSWTPWAGVTVTVVKMDRNPTRLTLAVEDGVVLQSLCVDADCPIPPIGEYFGIETEANTESRSLAGSACSAT
jgi:hypothetical protein